MSFRAPISLPPTLADLAVAKACARHVTPGLERALQTLTWAADEKVILAGTAAFWAATRSPRCGEGTRRRADHMLACAVVASALPHLIKRVVRRRRPRAHHPCAAAAVAAPAAVVDLRRAGRKPRAAARALSERRDRRPRARRGDRRGGVRHQASAIRDQERNLIPDP